MPNRSIPELTENTSPALTDLVYLAKKSYLGFYLDRRCLLSVLKSFSVFCRTIKKGSSYVVLSSDCDKRWVSNNGALVNITFILPATVVGAEIGFVVEEAHKITISPQSTDKIMPTGVTDGVSIQSSTQGSSIYLKGYVDGWLAVSETGTWAAVP